MYLNVFFLDANRRRQIIECVAELRRKLGIIHR